MTGIETSRDTTGTKATRLESATTESTMWVFELKLEECATELKATPTQVTGWGVVTHTGVCEKSDGMVAPIHRRIVCFQPG